MVRLLPIRERMIAIFVVGGLAMFHTIACQHPDASSADSFAADRDKKDAPDKPPRQGDQFAEDRAPPEVKPIDFDAKRSMQYLKDLCAIGPRISGSEGMKRQQELLQKHFEKHGAKVEFQKFDGKQPSQAAAVPMANMIVIWNPEAKRRVMFCGHYDTKPIADMELRERDWRKPFLSANDGTSTVAWMMELAHHMKDLPMKIGVDFVIFDGEEFINDKERDKFFLGSDYFGKQYTKDKPKHEYIAAVLLDLFAGKNASYPVEQNSRFLAGPVVESIWMEAKRLGVKSFLWEQGPEVQDDHLALNRARIPAVDIIDFNYKHWHRLTDLPEECSGEKMAEVAKVLMSWAQRLR